MRIRTGLVILAALAAGMTIVPGALGQTAGIPTVGVSPVGTTLQDPGDGRWFYTIAAPGQTKSMSARLSNPAGVPQTVRLTLADLVYDPQTGAPRIPNPPYRDIGTWGAFDRQEVTVPAASSMDVPFSVKAPEGAEPGDHVGVVMLQHVAEEGNGQIKIVKRVATKLYVTVPGDARPEYSIARWAFQQDSKLFPRKVSVTVWVRNDGRVRLSPVVRIGGKVADGSAVLLTHEVEHYTATFDVPFWGGPRGFQVNVVSRLLDNSAGPAQQQFISTFVFPWHLLVLVLLATASVFPVRRLARRRGANYAALQTDLLRIERLLSAQVGGSPAQHRAPGDDPDLVIRAAIKQARRAGDHQTEDRLRGKLHAPASAGHPEADDSALAAILHELAAAAPERRDELIAEARTYGIPKLRTHAAAIDALPRDVRMKLLFRAPARGPHAGGAARTRPRAGGRR